MDFVQYGRSGHSTEEGSKMFGTTLGIVVLLAAGAIGALTIEHGWGWILAKFNAVKAKV